jgi:hypothetical protein
MVKEAQKSDFRVRGKMDPGLRRDVDIVYSDGLGVIDYKP